MRLFVTLRYLASGTSNVTSAVSYEISTTSLFLELYPIYLKHCGKYSKRMGLSKCRKVRKSGKQ